MKRKIVIGVTGASGALYAKMLIEKVLQLSEQIAFVGLVFSDTAKGIYMQELGKLAFTELQEKDYKVKFEVFENHDFYAPFASGSSVFDTLFIVPCSMATVAKIANGLSIDLIARTADVMLKERRKVILGVRETPYQRIHLQNMLSITDAGGIVAPISPTFYQKTTTLRDIVSHQIDRWLTMAGLVIDNRFLWNDTL